MPKIKIKKELERHKIQEYCLEKYYDFKFGLLTAYLKHLSGHSGRMSRRFHIQTDLKEIKTVAVIKNPERNKPNKTENEKCLYFVTETFHSFQVWQ